MSEGRRKRRTLIACAAPILIAALVCAALWGAHNGRVRGETDGLARGDAAGRDAGRQAGYADGLAQGRERAEAEVQKRAALMLDKDADSYPVDAAKGNTGGNLISGGLAASGGGFVYYNLDGDIYRMTIDAGETALQCSHRRAHGLLYLDGYIYHAVLGQGVWRSPAQGGTCEQISEAPTNRLFGIVGGMLYYTSADDQGKLYRQNLDTLAEEKLSSGYLSYVNVTENGVYFTMGDDRRFLYRCELDGKNVELLCEMDCHWVNVVGDSIFFSVYDRNEESKFYRMNLDGSGLTELYIGSLGVVNVTPHGVFCNNGLRNSELYLLSLDGKTLTRMGRRTTYINVVSGWVFYDSEGKLYRLRADGSDETCLSDTLP